MKITLYYYWDTASYLDDDRRVDVTVYERDLTSVAWSALVFMKAEEVEIPDCQAPSEERRRNEIIGNLNDMKEKLQAETFMKIKQIDEKIQNLLSIENKEPQNDYP